MKRSSKAGNVGAHTTTRRASPKSRKLDKVPRTIYPPIRLMISMLILSGKYISRRRRQMDLPLDENQGRLSYWLFYAQRCVAYAHAEVMRVHCEERGKPYSVTPPQWGALTLLLARDGLTIGSMSQKRGVDAPTATGIIKRLEQNGLVERRHDRADRRVVKVYLTAEGRDILSSLATP